MLQDEIYHQLSRHKYAQKHQGCHLYRSEQSCSTCKDVKVLIRYEKPLIRNHDKATIYHCEDSIYHDKVTIYHDKTTMYHDKVTIYHDKATIYLGEDSVYHDKATIYHDKSTIYHNKVTIHHDKVRMITDFVVSTNQTMSARFCERNLNSFLKRTALRGSAVQWAC
uniref:Uncharacterized protein n=1 Tax=Araneus ventricosus TaxID=182803 RepID=A0A4Y2F922_ARAVE|nr:hypothetical protein AVEN_40870-1 [Araneus ventricosus]GBM37983.1 hypothetical protein AVEN_48434-1 [Araneus ventricosus]